MNNPKETKNTITRKSVNTILRDLFNYERIEFNNYQNNLNKKHNLYFRGESSYYEFRTPSLYLQKNLTNNGSEYYYRVLLNELGRDDYQENTSLVRLISELQHYGAKTRMLDITKNPLIALYFAVEKDNDKPGYVYIYSDKLNEKFDTGHTIAIKSALNFMPQDIINNFFTAIENLIRNNKNEYHLKALELITVDNIKDIELSTLYKYRHSSFVTQNYPEQIREFMELLNQRARVRERLNFPVKIYNDLQRAHIVIPSKTTDRIRQQQGAFIYPRFVNTFKKDHDNIKQEISESIDKLSVTLFTPKKSKKEAALEEYTSFSVIKIDPANKEEIRRELELLGITEGFVYPDIEHQSKALLNILNNDN